VANDAYPFSVNIGHIRQSAMAIGCNVCQSRKRLKRGLFLALRAERLVRKFKNQRAKCKIEEVIAPMGRFRIFDF
jgi:hypothetical protein